MDYNNMKEIRETYGATQEDIAKVAGVSRSTVSQWENGNSKAPDSYLEKLSIFYGIGPESFYEKSQIDKERKDMLIEAGKKEREVREASNQKRNKADEFANMMREVSFNEAINRFMFSMKMLLALADQSELKDLKLAYEINEKMARRLKAIIQIREDEEKEKEENKKDTLFDLFDSFTVEL